MCRLGIATVLIVLMSGCVLGRGPGNPQYYEPAVVAHSSVMDARADLTLRLNPVAASAHLKERLVWRDADVELGFYDLHRWTQPPAAYVDRRLSAELFEVYGIRRAKAGAYPTLDVKLQAFDLVFGDERVAVVDIHVLLSDARRISLLEKTFVTTSKVERRNIESASRAFGDALEEALRQISSEVVTALDGAN